MIATTRELAVIAQASRMLDEARSLEEITSIRNKAEAARSYVKAAKLGLELQNCAAEVKLRAERKAGVLLRSFRLRGGDRRSKRHAASLNLSDLGISRDQSKRWQHIASVSDTAFAQYLKCMGDQGREITSAGVLRIASKGQPSSRSALSASTQSASPQLNNDDGSRGEMLQELLNHCSLLGDILRPVCEEAGPELKRGEKRGVGRLIGEMSSLIVELIRFRMPGRH